MQDNNKTLVPNKHGSSIILILAVVFGLFCAVLTFVCLKYADRFYSMLRTGTVYCVDFTWNAGNMKPANRDLVISTAGRDIAIEIERCQIIANGDIPLSDCEKLLNSRYVTDRVKTQLSLEYPELTLEGIPYSKQITLSRETHLVNCSFFSESGEMALAAATVTQEVFLDTLKNELGFSEHRLTAEPPQVREIPKYFLSECGAAFLFSCVVFFLSCAFFLSLLTLALRVGSARLFLPKPFQRKPPFF